MHFYTLVVVDPDQVDIDDRAALTDHVERAMAPFDENAEGEGEQVYLSEGDLQEVASAYDITLPAPNAPAPQRPAVRGGLRAQLAGAGTSGTVEGPPPDRARALARIVDVLPGYWGGECGIDEDGRVWSMSYSNPDGAWDWWQIGGRWSGVLDGYDPAADPRNQETCTLCSGTGTRPDADSFGDKWKQHCNGCNGCMGSGTSQKWPTAWADHAGDVAPVADLLARTDTAWVPAALLDASGTWHSSGGGYFGPTEGEEQWAQDVRKALTAAPDAWVVVVDCHT